MNTSHPVWKKLLLFFLGLTIGAVFCMKIIEMKFDGYSILGLELFDSHKKISSLFQTIDDQQLSLLRFNLIFDFAFMAGIYPLISTLCVLAANKTVRITSKVLMILAGLQIIAWVCDILENLYLLKWSSGATVEQFGIFHFIVWVKWIIALAGILMALLFIFRKKRIETIV